MNTKTQNYALEILDTPWLRKNIEGHLIFGPFVNRFPFGWVFLSLFLLYFIWGFAATDRALFLRFVSNLDKLFFIIIAVYFLKQPKYVQAAIGWCIVKFAGGLIAFVCLIAGGIVGFFREQPDAIHITLLAIIWLPGIEFIPKFSEIQKFITIGRILASIPIFFLWYQTGTWH